MGEKLQYAPRPSRRKIEFTKEELEDLLWQMPTSDIAFRYNVSSKAIEKRAKLLGIPKPPRGYWALVKKLGDQHPKVLKLKEYTYENYESEMKEEEEKVVLK